MKQRRILGAAAATAAVSLALATSAIAAPVDIGEDNYEAPVANTIWESAAYDSYGFTIEEASIFADTVDPTDPWAGVQVNGDAFDGFFEVWVGDEAYGQPTCGVDTCSYVVDVTTAGGDVIVQAPPQTMSGLQVAVQHRYYANGDLGRALVSYTNPGATAVAVGTGVFSNYGSDDATTLEADFTGDAAVTAADRWIVTGDTGFYDPVLSTVWWGPQASLPPAEALLGDGTGDYYLDESWAGFNVTVQPGQTVYLAFFTGIYGWLDAAVASDVVAPDGGLAADAVVADSYDNAVVAATAAAAEFNTFSGRLVAGIPAGAPVLNWGTVGGAAPATPVVGGAAPATPVVVAPAFTG